MDLRAYFVLCLIACAMCFGAGIAAYPWIAHILAACGGQ